MRRDGIPVPSKLDDGRPLCCEKNAAGFLTLCVLVSPVLSVNLPSWHKHPLVALNKCLRGPFCLRRRIRCTASGATAPHPLPFCCFCPEVWRIFVRNNPAGR